MSILKDKFITNRTEKENINKKIKETHVQPTEQEQNTAQDIIRKVSEQYAEELISKDISDISNQIAATVREYCNQLDLTYEEQKRIEKTVCCIHHTAASPLSLHKSYRNTGTLSRSAQAACDSRTAGKHAHLYG